LRIPFGFQRENAVNHEAVSRNRDMVDHQPEDHSCVPAADQPPAGEEYAVGPGNSTWMVPSGSVVVPRAFVSWRSPVPSGRIAKSCSPNGLAPMGSQLDWKSTAPVRGSTNRLEMLHAGFAQMAQPVMDGRPSHGRWVTWRRPVPGVSMEK